MNVQVSVGKIQVHEMDSSEHERIIECLSKFTTESRLETFEATLANRTREVCLVLEHVANAHNASAVLRSAEAFGVFEVHVVPQPESRFSLSRNVASGANKWLDINWHNQIENCFLGLKERGYEVWASDLQSDSVSIDEIDVTKKIALVFGNERNGISQVAREHADRRFIVPMQGFVESLNISVAAAVSCYHVMQKRRTLACQPGLAAADHRAILALWLTQTVRASEEILRREGINIPVNSPQKFQFVE